MALTPGKRAAKRIMRLLDEDYESLTLSEQEMLYAHAGRIMAEAFNIYEELAKFTVVGQLYKAQDGTKYDPGDPAADKVALGNYQTAKQAADAARAMTVNSSTGEMFRSWVLKVHHGTPFSWFSERRDKKKYGEEENADVTGTDE